MGKYLRYHHFLRQRWALVIGVLLAIASGLVVVQATTGTPSSDMLRASGIGSPLPTPTARPDRQMDPFPSTSAMTDTIKTVLAAYEEARFAGLPEPVAVPLPGTKHFLPVVASMELPTPTPTLTATPTDTASPTPTLTATPTNTASPTPTDTASPTPTATATSRPEPVDSADIAVTVWPAPSIKVGSGNLLAYEVRVKNYGPGRASRTSVKLPVTWWQLSVVDSRFSRRGDWVSESTPNYVVITFAPIAQDEYVTATIRFRSSKGLADNTVLPMRASYEWSDANGNGTWQSNWAPVLAAPGDASAPWVWVGLDPTSGRFGTTHHFYSDRFLPGEGIVTWLNTPSGVRPLDLRGVADASGRVWLDFNSRDLMPGTYSLVLFGARSNLTGIATFSVTW